jgi:hypothetical protein
MKLLRAVGILVCAVLFFAGLAMPADGIDARDCQRMAGVLFIAAFIAAPVMCGMDSLMRRLARIANRVASGENGVPSLRRTVPVTLWLTVGAAFLSFAIGASLSALWKGFGAFWGGLVAAGFGIGLLLGFGVCWWVLNKSKVETPPVSHQKV